MGDKKGLSESLIFKYVNKLDILISNMIKTGSTAFVPIAMRSMQSGNDIVMCTKKSVKYIKRIRIKLKNMVNIFSYCQLF